MAREDEPLLTDFGDLFLPKEAAEPILSKPVRAALLNWLTEIFASDELDAVGISPRKKALFDGPPGVGKTTLAHHLCARLGLPMLAVRPETIIDCWVGSTGRNIGALFQAAAQDFSLDGSGKDKVPVVLFLDEFDALGGKRTAIKQGADAARNEAVNTLLQRIEQHKGFIIAATNFASHLDPAIWRRFDMQITLELPGMFEREQILKRYLEPYGLPTDALERLAGAMATASPALMRQFCEGLKREIIIGPKLNSDMDKAAVVSRLITAIHPHPDLGKPPLWSNENASRERDLFLDVCPWPLPLAVDLGTVRGGAMQPESKPMGGDNVVVLGARK